MSQTRQSLSAEEWKAIWPRCWRRIRSWRVPPRWNPLDWWEEARAEAALAACSAALDFDPTRGVPRPAFLYQRIVAGVWSLYRREWAYGRYLRGPRPLEEWSGSDVISPPRVDQIGVAQFLDWLGTRDRFLIWQLFWDGKTEKAVARKLGLSQQAVSARKLAALRFLRSVVRFVLEESS